MNAISTISAKALGPILLDYLPQSKFAEKALQTTGLPLDALGDPDAQLPQLGVWKLANRLALLEGNPCFSHDCVFQSQYSPSPLTASEIAYGSTDPIGLLCNYVESLNRYTPRTRFWWEIYNDEFVFRRLPMEIGKREGIQVEFYALAIFLRFLRDHVSEKTRPSAVHLRAPASMVLNPGVWGQAPVFFNCRASGLAVRLRDITHQSDQGIGCWLEERRRVKNCVLSQEEEIDRFKRLVRSYLASNDCAINSIAAALGLSTRTLQRKLATWGMSFSAILDDQRMKVAIQELGSHNLGITAIARKLGYKHAGDFTRAFKRRTKMTPTEYRGLAGGGSANIEPRL
jgi:AraC-like DNA-binding protein